MSEEEEERLHVASMKALHALHIAKDVGALEVALRAATVLDTHDMPALAAEIDLATTRLRALRPGSAALRAAAAPAAAPAATSSPSDDEEMPVGLPPPRARAARLGLGLGRRRRRRRRRAAALVARGGGGGAAALAAAAPAAPSAAVAAGCFEFSAQPDGTVRVHVPRQHVGKLIGRGGANIAALRDKCKMALSVKKSEDGSGIVTLDGTREAIARARRAIDECFSEELRALEPSPRDAAGGGARGGGGGSGSAAERVVCMAAPLTANQVGRLIGQRGERIQALRQARAIRRKRNTPPPPRSSCTTRPPPPRRRGCSRRRSACAAPRARCATRARRSSNSSTSGSSGRRSRRPKRRPPTSAPAPPRCRRRDRRRPPRRRRRRRPR